MADVWCERRKSPAGLLETKALQANLQTHVVPILRSHPGREFILFIPPYSVMIHLPKGGPLR